MFLFCNSPLAPYTHTTHTHAHILFLLHTHTHTHTSLAENSSFLLAFLQSLLQIIEGVVVATTAIGQQVVAGKTLCHRAPMSNFSFISSLPRADYFMLRLSLLQLSLCFTWQRCQLYGNRCESVILLMYFFHFSIFFSFLGAIIFVIYCFLHGFRCFLCLAIFIANFPFC